MAKKQKSPSDKLDQSLVRWPKGMREQVEKRAAKTGRSMNAEIIELVRNGLVQANIKESGHKPSGIVSPQLVQELELFMREWQSKVAFERLTEK